MKEVRSNGMHPITHTARLDIMALITSCIEQSSKQANEVISKVNNKLLELLHDVAFYEQALRTIPRLEVGAYYELTKGMKYLTRCTSLGRDHAEFLVLCSDSSLEDHATLKLNGCISLWWSEPALDNMKRVEAKNLTLYVGWPRKTKHFSKLFKGGA
jgi:hypothetical protein